MASTASTCTGSSLSVRGRLISPSDLVRQSVPGQVAVRGDRVVYTLRHHVDGGERTELWTVDHTGGAAVRLTSSPGQDFCPRISPDGSMVAFLRSRSDEQTQAWLLDLDSGEPHVLTVFARGVLDLDWSPDGRWLAVLAEDDHSASVYRADGAPDDSPSATALVLLRTDWRRDGDGEAGLCLYPRHLHRVPIDGGAPERLTAGPWTAFRPRVDTHGSVWLLADTAADADLHPARQVHRITPGGSAMEQVTHMPGGVVRYHLTKDGIRCLAHVDLDSPDDQPARWFDLRVGIDGGAGEVPREVMPGDERWFGLLGEESDLHDWQLELDDTAVITTASAASCTAPVTTHDGRVIVSDAVVCGALAQDGPRQVGVLAFGSGATTDCQPWAPDVYALEAGAPRRLTEHGGWLTEYLQPRFETLEVTGAAGPITVHVLHPPEQAVVRGTVLALHGGPTGQWSVVPTIDALLLASAGYRVAMPNLRGSIDRGAAWVAALHGAWGDVDAHDALSVCDELVARGLATPGKLGVCGLSYGGFLTQWLIGVTDRFSAAVSENGVTNQVAAWSASDLGPAFCRSAGLSDPLSPEGVQRLWETSPLRNVGTVRTPLLMLQGADDRTCPSSDNEQFFVALRSLHRVVEYVIYPEESHLMQATGRIDRRIDRHQRMLAWFDKHLAQGSAR